MRAFYRGLRIFAVITLFFFCWTFLPLWQVVAYAAQTQGQGSSSKGQEKISIPWRLGGKRGEKSG